MKILMYFLGAILILTGMLCFLQGINIIPGSFMTGRPEWAIYGGISALLGILLTIRARKQWKTGWLSSICEGSFSYE